MLLSMTGFGKSIVHYKHKTFHIELRSVNSRHLEIRFKLPNTYKNRELSMRSFISQRAIRGKLDCSIIVHSDQGDEEFALNSNLFKVYYNQLDELRKELGSTDELISAILKLPNVIEPNDAEATQEEWEVVQQGIEEAIDALSEFRRSEGQALQDELRVRAVQILKLVDEITEYEPGRADKVRERIRTSLKDIQETAIDENRFEQELIYYLEKYDITEEKVRLKQHCNYFMDVLDNGDEMKGRKLNFISQEIGREINTLGAKANDAKMQRLVVQMKDELEKIKEQVANVI